MRESKGKSIILLPTDYVVIDIETTGLDYEFCNIIEISALKYRDGVCVDTFTSLVQPPLQEICYPLCDDGPIEWIECYVDEFITNLTGITNEMLASAPLPSEVIPNFLNFVGNSVLVGHNINFDINFIYDAAMETCSTPLKNDFIDTLRIARKVFTNLDHHRLSDIAQACSIETGKAHRAERDCITTAKCYEVMRNMILSDFSEAEFLELFNYRYKKQLASVIATVDHIDSTNPFFGKIVVFTGTLSSMSRKEAFQAVVNLGGIPENSITKKTNYLVIGSAEFVKSVKEGKTNKMKKAESYISAGEEILILSENAFFDLISDYIE